MIRSKTKKKNQKNQNSKPSLINNTPKHNHKLVKSNHGDHLVREREDQILIKVGFDHGSSTMGSWPWVFSYGFREDEHKI